MHQVAGRQLVAADGRVGVERAGAALDVDPAVAARGPGVARDRVELFLALGEVPRQRLQACRALLEVERQQRRQAVPRTAERQTLANAQDQQRHHGSQARVLVARQERHPHRAHAQQEECHGQLGAPAPAPLDGHGNGRAHRAHDKSDRQQRKRHQRAIQVREEWKEEGREDENAGDPENEEVEILGRASDDHAHSNFAGGHVFMRISPRERGGAFFKAGRRVSGRGGAAHEQGSLSLFG